MSKKRTVQQKTQSVGEAQASKGSNQGDFTDKRLWIEKHAPQTIEELVVNKKKVKEFIDIAEEGGGGGFLVLHGAPGSCKNAMIKAYCLQNGAKLISHSDVKTQHLDDLYGLRQTVAGF